MDIFYDDWSKATKHISDLSVNTLLNVHIFVCLLYINRAIKTLPNKQEANIQKS